VCGQAHSEFPSDNWKLIHAAEGSGGSRFVGPLRDQDELHGLLTWIREQGWILRLVTATECPCPKKKCERRGLCSRCQAYHAIKGKQPYCLRSGTLWDRALQRISPTFRAKHARRQDQKASGDALE
jgi:hypothetical protein